MLETVADPQRILEGNGGELFAVREIEPGKCLVVVYRELANDGFIITAFVTRRLTQINRRNQAWP